MPITCRVVLAVSVCAAFPAAVVKGGFAGIGFLPGSPNRSVARAVSADGSTVVGATDVDLLVNTRALRWTASTGIQALDVPDVTQTTATSVSADGSIIAGAFDTDGFYRWTSSGTDYQVSPANIGAVQFAVMSSNATTVVGRSRISGSGPRGFRWTAATGYVPVSPLGTAVPDSFAYLNGVSPNGAWSFGFSSRLGSSPRSFLLSPSGAKIDLGLVGGLGPGVAAISDDGQFAIASVATFDPVPRTRALAWTPQSGYVDLPGVPSEFLVDGTVTPVAMTPDHSIIIGTATKLGSSGRVFVLRPDGFRFLDEILDGDMVIAGWSQLVPTGLSADGQTIVGYGTDPQGRIQGWVTTIPAPSGLGLIVLGGIVARRHRRSPHI